MEEYDVVVQCRACLSTNSTEYIDMESSMTRDYTILECFNICTDLKAQIADQLPVTICTLCSHDLQIAFQFIQEARQADSILRENLASHKKEVMQENDEDERLEYLESVERFEGVAVSDDEEEVDEGEHMLELHLVQEEGEEEEKQEEQKLELVDDCYETMETYKELEAIEEHMLDEEILEQDEYFEEKPQVEQLDLDMQQRNFSANELNSNANNSKVSKQEIPESYPEDEIDDEYLLEHNQNADQSSQGWKCFECKRVLRSDVSYEGHLNMHKNMKPYKCTQCRSTFRCRNALDHHASKRHNRDRTGQKCFTCDICNKPFRLATLLLEHRRAEHKTLEICTRCSKSFKSKDLLDEHMTLIHPPTNTMPIQCPYCENPPLTKPRLVEHLRLQHPTEHRKHLHTVGRPCDENKVTPWQCEECFRYYRTEMLLKDHRNTHNNERPHTCIVCDRRFFTANNLRSHMRSMHHAEYEKRLAESSESIVQCKICPKKLLQKNMGKHMATHERKEKQQSAEGGATAKYLCAYCQRECKSRKVLNHHMKLHQSQEAGVLFECSDCERQYPTHYHLEHHRKQAHKERDHFCPICGNAFKLKNQLVNHMKLHLEKNIACPHCDKKYARQFDLNVHLRSHTGELPYACHLCEKRFAIKVRLTYHLQKHLGIKHRCKQCKAEFNSKQKLKAHSYKHTGMPYRCELCDNHGFANRDVFKRHLLRVHNSSMTDEDLVEMFQRNTGKSTRIRRIDGMGTTTAVVRSEELNVVDCQPVAEGAEVFVYNSEISIAEEIV